MERLNLLFCQEWPHYYWLPNISWWIPQTQSNRSTHVPRSTTVINMQLLTWFIVAMCNKVITIILLQATNYKASGSQLQLELFNMLQWPFGLFWAEIYLLVMYSAHCSATNSCSCLLCGLLVGVLKYELLNQSTFDLVQECMRMNPGTISDDKESSCTNMRLAWFIRLH